jgi:hypothetical protein
MVDVDRQARLEEEFHQQTAVIRWHDLQTYYARGSVVEISSALNLVQVAVQLGMDNTPQFQQWITAGDIAAVNEDRALEWYESNRELWAVVAPPWVLVQIKEAAGSD